MKKIDFHLSIIIITSLLMFLLSCNKGDDIQYSCDQKVDEFAKKYKSVLSNITREQLVQLPTSYQKAVVLTLTPERRMNLWKEKLQIVMEQNDDPALHNRIQELYNHLSIEDYDRLPTDPPRETTLDFVAAWENDVLGNQLMDSVNFIVNYCTLMTLEELDILVYHPETIDLSWFEGYDDLPSIDGPGGGGGGGIDCECRYDIYCSILGMRECINGNCNPVWNCGVTGTSKCNGLCPESTVSPE